MQAGLNLRVFAERCGVTDEAVNDWVYGRTLPSLKACVLGALVLKVSMDEYLEILRASGVELPTEPYPDTGAAGRRRKRVRARKQA